MPSPDRGSRGVSRRDFVTAAVAIGGSAALSACLEREVDDGDPTATASDAPRFPTGSDPESLPSRQHAWNRSLVTDAHGNTVLPQRQLVLGLKYVGSTPPTAAERSRVADALASLDRAYAWGTGGDPAAAVNDGLLTLFGYSNRYFERVGAPVDLRSPESVLEAVGEDPDRTDGFDALLLLSSDYGSILLAAEQALFGDRDSLNGEPMDGDLAESFDVVERRSGVAGKGLPAEKLPDEDVPESAPMSMGFRSSFADNQAPEDRVTLREPPFAGGTTLLASRLRIDLDRWYDQSVDERVGEMFCPAHDADDVGETGARLGSDSGITDADADRVAEDAAEYGVVGHGQKVARARDDGFEPRILRRSEGVAAEVDDGAGFNFHSVQRDLDAFVDTRRAMNPDEYDDDVPAERHGIADYLETVARGTFLVPPRERRALPVHEP